jgi:CHAT domain-containing protein/tetratricopeptide (TPR) repeat protein
LATALNNLGAVLCDRGDYAGAEGFYRRALAMCEKLYPRERYPQGHPDLALCLNNLGLLLSDRGDDSRAEALLRRALAMCEGLYPRERYPQGHPELAGSLNNLGLLLHGREDYGGAEVLFRRALALCERLYPKERFPDGHPHLAASLNNLGAVLRDRGDYAGAEALFRRALALCEKFYPKERYPQGHPHRAVGLINLGSVLRDRGDHGKAEDFLRRALAMQEALLEGFAGAASEGEGLLLLASLPLTRDGYLSLAGPGAPTAEAAYAAVWDTKGCLARLLQARRRALLAAKGRATRGLARELTATRQELARLLLDPSDKAGDHGDRVLKLSARKAELEKRLAARLPAFKVLLASGRRKPAELITRLPEGAVFLDLVRYLRVEQDPRTPGKKGERWRACYAAFVLARGRPIRRVELPGADAIDKAVDAWRRDITAGLNDRGPAVAALRQRVWLPLAAALPAGTRVILLAPDGALTRLPWAALPGARPGSYLLEDCALATVPYGQFLLGALRGDAPAPVGKGLLLAVGDVAFGEEPAPAPPAGVELPAGRAPPMRAKGMRWRGLPGTAREGEQVQKLAGRRPVLLLRGAEAGAARLLAELPRARWAHLATHGFFADARFRSVLRLSAADYERGRRGERVGVGARNPLVLSGLVLAGANRPGAPGRGILTAEAIAGLDLGGLELAVLSACETGLGEVAGGEGVFGLQRGFHAAGARAVVASLWQVDDAATARLMDLFYDNLWRKKLPRLEALRRAQLALLHGSGGGPGRGPGDETPSGAEGLSRAPPRLWAAWVLSGDPGDLTRIAGAVPPPAAVAVAPGPDSKAPGPPWTLYLAAGLAGVALAGLAARRLRRRVAS